MSVIRLSPRGSKCSGEYIEYHDYAHTGVSDIVRPRLLDLAIHLTLVDDEETDTGHDLRHHGHPEGGQ